MKSLILPQNVKVPDGVLFQEIEGESVLLNLATEEYFGLDEVGTRFWQLVSENGKPAAALDGMLNEFAVERTVLQNDLANLVNDLSKNGLLEILE